MMADTRPTLLWGPDGAMYFIPPENLARYRVPAEQAPQVEATIRSLEEQGEVGAFDFENPHEVHALGDLGLTSAGSSPSSPRRWSAATAVSSPVGVLGRRPSGRPDEAGAMHSIPGEQLEQYRVSAAEVDQKVRAAAQQDAELASFSFEQELTPASLGLDTPSAPSADDTPIQYGSPRRFPSPGSWR